MAGVTTAIVSILLAVAVVLALVALFGGEA